MPAGKGRHMGSRDQENVLAEIGQLLVTWNNVEDNLRLLLMEICGGETPGNKILTAELNGVTLVSALRSAANEILPDDLALAIDSAAIRFDELRNHRNHFVHGARGVEDTVPYRALLKRTTARRELTIYDEKIVNIEIRDLTELIAVVGVEALTLLLDVKAHRQGKPYTSPKTHGWHPLPKIGSRTRKIC